MSGILSALSAAMTAFAEGALLAATVYLVSRGAKSSPSSRKRR